MERKIPSPSRDVRNPQSHCTPGAKTAGKARRRRLPGSVPADPTAGEMVLNGVTASSLSTTAGVNFVV
jgi:hypothetical protein